MPIAERLEARFLVRCESVSPSERTTNMWLPTLTLVGLLGVWLGGCGSTGPAPTPVPGRSNGEAVGERFDEMVSNPADITAVRLSFGRAFIREFEVKAGRVPNTIHEFLTPADPAFPVTPDGWGTPVRYRPLGTDYELRSAGPDRVFCTLDDIVVTKTMSPPELRGPLAGQETRIENHRPCESD
jgi:hypothetical protein